MAAGYLFNLGKKTGMTKMRLQDHVDIVKSQLGRADLEAQCSQGWIPEASLALKRPGAKKC